MVSCLLLTPGSAQTLSQSRLQGREERSGEEDQNCKNKTIEQVRGDETQEQSEGADPPL